MRGFRLLLFDLCLIAAATTFALALRDNFEVTEPRLVAFAPYLALTVFAAALIFPVLGINRSVWRFTAMRDYLRLVGAVVVTVGAAVAAGFAFNRLEGVARTIPIIQALLMIFALVGVRVSMRLLHASHSRPVQLVLPVHVGGPESVLVAGINNITDLYLRSAQEFARERLQIVGLLDLVEYRSRVTVQGHPVLGTVAQLPAILQDLAVHGTLVDRIVVTVSFDKLSPEALAALLEIERDTSIFLEFLTESLGFERTLPRIDEKQSSEPVSADGPNVYSIKPADLAALAKRPYVRIKRVFDIISASVLLILLAPLMLLVSIVVATTVGRPVIFWQRRPGLGGVPFKLHKFRTMSAAHDSSGHRVPDAERLSLAGSFLRRTRLDELPQLFNILTGDMSFVGPRPLLPIDQPKGCAARLLVRPGLTGWAQVKGGRSLSAADKGPLDVWYVQNISLALDVTILLSTVPIILLGEHQSRGYSPDLA